MHHHDGTSREEARRKRVTGLNIVSVFVGWFVHLLTHHALYGLSVYDLNV